MATLTTDHFQDLVDGISRLAAASATLEDRDFNLVAFASQSGGLDVIRQRSILQRRSSPRCAPGSRASGSPAATVRCVLPPTRSTECCPASVCPRGGTG
ncbi:hypothetical protein ACFQ9X_51245 [Catenulispora yoronensis]